MCRPAQITCDDEAKSVEKRSVRVQNYVQEVRYCCDSPRTPKGSSRLDEFYSRNSSWRAARTLDGSMYYYNYSSHEMCWERPAKNATEVSTAIGDIVEVFCEGTGTWHAGYVEKIRNAEISVAFQMPYATEDTWVKATLHSNHKNLRGFVGTSSPAPSTHINAPSPTYEDTELPANWTPEERDAYNQFWKEATNAVEDSADTQKLIAYFMRSGLQEHTVNEIWQVANPDLKPSLGAEEFRVCCRLMAHCQAVFSECGDSSIARALKKGGHKLRSVLRSQCLRTPAPRLPTFAA